MFLKAKTMRVDLQGLDILDSLETAVWIAVKGEPVKLRGR